MKVSLVCHPRDALGERNPRDILSVLLIGRRVPGRLERAGGPLKVEHRDEASEADVLADHHAQLDESVARTNGVSRGAGPATLT